MSKDERVDGPKIAAEILKRMPRKDQERLVKAIHESAPDIAPIVEENLFNFEEIAELSPQSVQALLKEIDQRDLILSFKAASQPVKDAFLRSVTERRRTIIEDEVRNLPPTKISEVEAAQRRIIGKIEELRTKGLIRRADRKDVYV